MEPTPRVENDVVRDLAELAVDARPVEGGALLISARAQHLTDLEKYGEAPHAKRGTVDLTTWESLARYVNTHKGDGTAIYADVEARTVEALLNGHCPAWDGAEELAYRPGWGDHRALLTLRHTPEWKFWSDADGKPHTQIQFAHRIERGLADIADPPGADLLEVAQSFDATTTVDFASSHRLKDGQRQLTYKETTTARAGETGLMVVPETFTLRIAPFEGTQAVNLMARLRYRITEGDLTIFYELDRPEDVVRAAFDGLLEEIASQTELEPFAGTAPTALR